MTAEPAFIRYRYNGTMALEHPAASLHSPPLVEVLKRMDKNQTSDVHFLAETLPLSLISPQIEQWIKVQ